MGCPWLKASRSSGRSFTSVVLGAPKHVRSSYRLWEEPKAPAFVLEIASESTYRTDPGEKRSIYAGMGVSEYWQCDPAGGHFDPQPDRYGRALEVCYLKGEDLNGWLVSQGHALAYRRYGTQYVEQEEAARPAKRGVWAGAFVAPWEWRAGERLHVTSATEACPGRTSSASWPCMTTTATAGLRAGRRGATALRRCRAVIQLIRTCTTGMVTAWSVNSLMKRRPTGRTDCLWPPAVLPAHAICTHMVG